MISVSDLKFVVALAKNNSLAAAARELNVSPPAVSQRLAALEEKMALRLVERSGRVGILLTSDGEHLAERAINILADIDDVTSEMAERHQKIVGRLKIMAPVGFGRILIAPQIANFRVQHPDVSIELTLSNDLGRMPDHSWDIIIQVSPLSDSSLIAVHLARNERFICASPDYIKKHGTLNTPQDLMNHQCITICENGNDETLWTFKDNASTRDINVRVKSSLSTNDGESARMWAVKGLGIVQRSEWNLTEDIKAKRLVRLLPNYDLPAAPIVALVSSRNNRSMRVQSFIEFLKESLVNPPWRD